MDDAMNEVLKRNLDRLGARDEGLASRLASVAPQAGLEVTSSSESGLVTGVAVVRDDAGVERKITLASRHRPGAEASRFADQADLKKHAVVLVIGVGLGHHVREVAKRAAGKGVVIVYEPSESRLRGVLEHVDADWLGAGHVELLAGELEVGDLTRRLEGRVSTVAQGVQMLSHGPTCRLDEEAVRSFAERFTQFVSFCRTNVATTMVIALQTCRNYADNLGRYAAGESINALKGLGRGCPAVLVAAGPSLAKNVALLENRDVRDRVIVIAAQTALKPLLARGIRPNFVTALDYHEISRRFYEGLPALDDVTLVAEPKANRAIVDNYPGPVRMCRSPFIDTLLGEMGRRVDALRAGSTVAHLNFYLAQYLGCDPIVLTGQDLGFSDGLYYMPGTAIHEVWGAELGPFNTLEMMEWQRVARHKTHLRKLEDIHGKPIYTDEQMLTYLRQFERDFGRANQTIIDATEGGLPKAHTERMGLAEALERYATGPAPALPTPGRELDLERLKLVHELLVNRTREVRTLAQLSRRTIPILKEMIANQEDQRKVERLFEKLEKNKREVAALQEAFALVNELNQIGAFNRLRADRAIEVEGADAVSRQRAQLERDVANVSWLIEACEQVLGMFERSAERMDGQLRDGLARIGAVA